MSRGNIRTILIRYYYPPLNGGNMPTSSFWRNGLLVVIIFLFTESKYCEFFNSGNLRSKALRKASVCIEHSHSSSGFPSISAILPKALIFILTIIFLFGQFQSDYSGS